MNAKICHRSKMRLATILWDFIYKIFLLTFSKRKKTTTICQYHGLSILFDRETNEFQINRSSFKWIYYLTVRLIYIYFEFVSMFLYSDRQFVNPSIFFSLTLIHLHVLLLCLFIRLFIYSSSIWFYRLSTFLYYRFPEIFFFLVWWM